MKIYLIIGIIAMCTLLISCNPHTGEWDRESCQIAGYEEPIKPDYKNIVKCRDECGSQEVGIHYKKLEMLRQFPNTKIQPDYIKEIRKKKCCECTCE